MKDDKSFEKLRDQIRKYGDNIAILEEVIDVTIQQAYFKQSQSVKVNLNVNQVLAGKDGLFDEGLEMNAKKRLLTQLASVNSVEAFRTIEAYANKPDKELADWAILAKQESKMALESSFLDNPPLFISTGLGGKGNCLRYFAVVKSSSNTAFTPTQLSTIQNEFEWELKKVGGELESCTQASFYASLLVLVPILEPLKHLFARVVTTCNDLGDFVDPGVIVTNVRVMDHLEIEELLLNEQSASGQHD